MTNYSAYKGKDGFAFVTSNYLKTVTAEEWGGSTKEKIRIEKRQFVCKVNSNSRITSYYSYSQTITNKDPKSGEWYKKEQEVSSTSLSAKITYGSRTSSNGKKDALLNKFDSPYLLGIDFTVPVSVNNSIYNPTIKTEKERTSMDRFHIVSVVYLNMDTASDIYLDPTIVVRSKNSIFSDEVEETKKVLFFIDDPLLKTDSGKLKINFQGSGLKVIFDFYVAMNGSSIQIVDGKAYTM